MAPEADHAALHSSPCPVATVVTGATDGIGLAFANKLAKKGINILLVSRTQSKLDASAKEIKGACGPLRAAAAAFVPLARPPLERGPLNNSPCLR